VSKHSLAAAALALTAVVVAAHALAGNAVGQKLYLFKASLDTRQETPAAKDANGASGVLTATLTVKGKRGVFAWKLSFKNLSGRATAARVHVGAPGKSGPFAMPLCQPCNVGAHGAFFGPFGANSALFKALLNGGTYANMQTKKNPNGEIRGQIKLTGTK